MFLIFSLSCIFFIIYVCVQEHLRAAAPRKSETCRRLYEKTTPLSLEPRPCNAAADTPLQPQNSRKFPMDLAIPPLRIKIRLESSPPKSIMLVRRLAVSALWTLPITTRGAAPGGCGKSDGFSPGRERAPFFVVCFFCLISSFFVVFPRFLVYSCLSPSLCASPFFVPSPATLVDAI